jgi:hypothetical protein
MLLCMHAPPLALLFCVLGGCFNCGQQRTQLVCLPPCRVVGFSSQFLC